MKPCMNCDRNVVQPPGSGYWVHARTGSTYCHKFVGDVALAAPGIEGLV